MHNTVCSDKELHLMILWEAARSKQAEILEDMSARFQVLDVINMTWSDEFFSSNLTRFYGEKLPDGSYKEKHCGRGDFLLILFHADTAARVAKQTSRGPEYVNGDVFDCKQLYRDWTGGGHKVHATNSEEETNHDLTLLLGVNPSDYISAHTGSWNGAIRNLSKDLEGSVGWKDAEKMFYVLNSTIPYVVMRNFEGIPRGLRSDLHDDIDFLTVNETDFVHVINAKKVKGPKYRAQYKLNIAKEDFLCDVRSIGDGYYDESWQRNILANRIYDSCGFFRPSEGDHHFSLLSHCLVHKIKISEDYRVTLGYLDNKYTSEALVDILLIYMKRFEYKVTQCRDLSVIYNRNVFSSDLAPAKSTARWLHNSYYNFKQDLKRWFGIGVSRDKI
ncbi:MAG: hypothetical protein RPR91_04755 [Colwellia sp.]